MTIIIGAAPAGAPAERKQAKKSGRPTKAELLEECAALGIGASPEMTNPELAALIEAARA